MNKPTVISTFAGCGGSSLGYHLAGFRELLAVEWDDNAVQCLKANFPSVDIFQGDIAKLSVDEVLSRTGLTPGELDVLDGSPPCQGFSDFGKRHFGDGRNQLFHEFVRLLRGLKPRAFVVENVASMATGKMALIFRDVLTEMKQSGYRVKARILNAKYYGVAQSRPRMIIIGVREDLNVEPYHPLPTSGVISVRAAWADIQNDPAEVTMLLDAGKRYGSYKSFAIIPMGQRLSDIIKSKSTGFSCRRLHPDLPSRTLVKKDGDLSCLGVLHPFEPRRLTVVESKRLSSFPDDFQFPGTWSDATQRIGNSVPPLFMKAIADHIKGNILAKVGQ